jgi:hypothetical protein
VWLFSFDVADSNATHLSTLWRMALKAVLSLHWRAGRLFSDDD